MSDHHTTTTGPKVHELKCWPPHFEEVLTGRKPFELRRNDRGFEVGDLLELREYDNTVSGSYTGRTCRREITCVLGDGDYGMEPGFVALGLAEQDHPALSLGRETQRLTEFADRVERLAATAPDTLVRKMVLGDLDGLRDLAKNPGDGGQGEAGLRVRLLDVAEQLEAEQRESPAAKAILDALDAPSSDCKRCGGSRIESFGPGGAKKPCLDCQPAPSYLSEEGGLRQRVERVVERCRVTGPAIPGDDNERDIGAGRAANEIANDLEAALAVGDQWPTAAALLSKGALQAGADAICIEKPATEAERNEVRIEIEAALDFVARNHGPAASLSSSSDTGGAECRCSEKVQESQKGAGATTRGEVQ